MPLVKCVQCANKTGVRPVFQRRLESNQKGLRLPLFSSIPGTALELTPH